MSHQLCTQLNKPFAARLWALLRRSNRKMEEMAEGAGHSTSTLYKWAENAAIMPAFRVAPLVREAGSVKRELAEMIIGAREAGLVVLDVDAASPEADLRDQAMGLSVDVGELTATIRAASQPGSDGGERITLAELEAILARVRELLRHGHELERGALRLKVV